jgi:CRP-like cAMP-binding protein
LCNALCQFILGPQAKILFALGNEDCLLAASLFTNKVLDSLDDGTIARLRLRPVALELRQEIASVGSKIDELVFIEEGMCSMTASFEDGSEVEVSIFGYESVIGLSALMGSKHSLNRVYMQLPGRGFSSPLKAASKEFGLCGRFQHLALRNVQAQLTQSMQYAGCNAKHNIKQRLARWLLICADRARSDSFSISHAFLADMLGSTRPTVSVAAGALKGRRLIEYSRGAVSILDRKGLERKACECYRVVREQLDNGI